MTSLDCVFERKKIVFFSSLGFSLFCAVACIPGGFWSDDEDDLFVKVSTAKKKKSL